MLGYSTLQKKALINTKGKAIYMGTKFNSHTDRGSGT